MTEKIIELFNSILINSQFKEAFWVMDLLCLSFVKDKHEYQFHIQCLTRVNKNKRIITSNGDFYYSQIHQEYDNFATIVEDMLLEKISGIVCKVDVLSCGDLKLHFKNGVSIEVFIDSSLDGAEQWRFLEVDSDKEHIVCYPNLFCME